jgi:hypothetical protein
LKEDTNVIKLCIMRLSSSWTKFLKLIAFRKFLCVKTRAKLNRAFPMRITK